VKKTKKSGEGARSLPHIQPQNPLLGAYGASIAVPSKPTPLASLLFF